MSANPRTTRFFVYAMVRAGRVLYVGRSKNMAARRARHARRWPGAACVVLEECVGIERGVRLEAEWTEALWCVWPLKNNPRVAYVFAGSSTLWATPKSARWVPSWQMKQEFAEEFGEVFAGSRARGRGVLRSPPGGVGRGGK
jgi:hypothetical protein